jgi:hypothetical protein
LEQTERDHLKETSKSLSEVNMPAAMAFRRIVLYIDDLDRCEPDKVVEVLQAVNMLLSFRLFVVMVAVDARWLSRSLETRYPSFFGLSGPADARDINFNIRGRSEDAVDGRPWSNEDKAIGRATAADYLEKIFQIPYWVPPMTAKASAAVVADLIAADRLSDQPPSAVERLTSEPIGGILQTPLPEEDDQPRSMAPPSRALGLTEDEIKTLTKLSPFVGGSPRRARRFVNVYRVAKASLTPAEIKTLEGGEHMALATQLAIATGAPNAFGAWMAVCENRSDDLTAGRPSDFAADDAEHGNIEGALASYEAMMGDSTDTFKKLAAQSARAARFSFVAPRKQFQRARTISTSD